MSVYLIPDDSHSIIHVNGVDLNGGTAEHGPAWTKSAPSPPFDPADAPIASVGPFATGNEYTLLSGTPFALGNVDWSVTIIVSAAANLAAEPTIVANYQHGDPNGFQIYLAPGFVGFLIGPTVEIDDNFTVPLSTLLVISAGFKASTQGIFLKVNNRAIVTGSLGIANTAPVTGASIGNYFDGSAFAPLDGQVFELLASTNTPSDALFTSIYNQVQANIEALTPIPESDVATFLAGAGLGLTIGGPTGNLFTGAVLPANVDGHQGGVPGLCVFVTSTGGPAPLPYMGPDSGSCYFHGIQISTRSAPKQQAAGIALARSIRDTLHRATIPMAGGGVYPFCLVKESQPLYLGQDSTYRHRWSQNLDLRSAGLP